jgi:hypothetical protein
MTWIIRVCPYSTCRENVNIATAYHGKSVAEQNSVDLAWNLFMDEQFESPSHLCST